MKAPWISRLAFTTALVFGLGVSPRTRANVSDGRVGARCASDDDCSSALFCEHTNRDLRLDGPARGLCTAPCARDDDCRLFAATALCLFGLCTEGCVLDSSFSAELDPGKCHGREEMACTEFCSTSACLTTVAACYPQCSEDAQCGPDFFCDLATGFCSVVPRRGDPLGSPCDFLAPEPTCLGACALVHSSVSTLRLAGRCAEACVLGTSSACSAAREHGIDAACLAAPWYGHGTGDLASCVQLCDCSSECPEGQSCEPADLATVSERNGICSDVPPVAGLANCLDDGTGGEGPIACPEGPERACRAAHGCLGTAPCLPNGDYGECQCIEDPEPAASPSAPRATTVAGGCALTRSAHADGAFVLILMTLFGKTLIVRRKPCARLNPRWSKRSRGK